MLRKVSVVEELKKKAIEEKAKEQLKEVVIPESNEIKEEIMTSNLVVEEVELEKLDNLAVTNENALSEDNNEKVVAPRMLICQNTYTLEELGFTRDKKGKVVNFIAEMFIEKFLIGKEIVRVSEIFSIFADHLC